MDKIVLDKFRYFSEVPWKLQISILLPIALAAVTNLVRGLVLAQQTAANIVVSDYFRRYPSTDGDKDGRTSDFLNESINKELSTEGPPP